MRSSACGATPRAPLGAIALTNANTPRIDTSIDGRSRIRTKLGCPRDVGYTYDTAKPIGRGAFGVVFRAKRDMADVAVKIVR